MVFFSLIYNVTVVFVTLAAVIYAYFKWSYQYWKRRNVPYLEPTFPFGNTPSPQTSKISGSDNIRDLYNEAKKKGYKYCGVYALAAPTLLVLDLDMLRNIMTKDFAYFSDKGLFANEKHDPIGAHLASLSGDRWKNLRSKLTPTFTAVKMKTMFQMIADCGSMMEQYFDEISNKDVAVDIKEVLGCFSTDVIGTCAFGLDCNSFKNPDSLFRQYGKKAIVFDLWDVIKMGFSMNFPNLARSLRIHTVKKDVAKFYTSVVKETIAYREKNNITRNDFLQLLIALKSKEENSEPTGTGKTLSMDEIIAQSFVFFIAGFETTSSTMTHVLFELSTHQEQQDKVREEVRTVLAKHDNQITYDAMNELVYVKQVMDETLRKYPVIFKVARKCVRDYKVPGEDLIIEKGTGIYVPIVGIHYDPDYYENPNEFIPERFSEENKKKRHPYAHIPFGDGPRACIGERFAIMQTRVALASILRNHKVTLNEKTKVPLKQGLDSPFLTPESGVWLNFERV